MRHAHAARERAGGGGRLSGAQTRRPPLTGDRSPPPPEACLSRVYGASPKGGTLIAEDVLDLETHESRLRTGGLRPAVCRRCGGPMHIHDYRSRALVGHAAQSITIGRFRCADRASCGAVVQVLPVFVARGLWRAWETVETVAFESGVGDTEPNVVEVPERTQRRWR